MAIAATKEQLIILAADLRFSARALAKTPVFVVAALFAIVLGVSATTTVFSLINAVLIRSLPYGDPEQLAYLWTPSPNTTGIPRERQPFYSDIVAWRNGSRSFEDITAVQRYSALLDGANLQRVGGARVTGNFFHTLKAVPQLGRLIDSGDDQVGKPLVVLISDSLWHSRFGGDSSVLGKSIPIDRRSHRVIGVMARDFSYPHGVDFPGQYQFATLPRTDVWLPAALTSKQQADREFDGFDAAIGRLRKGVSISQAQSELSAIEKRLNPSHPEGWRDLQALLVPFIETTIGPVRPLLRLLMAAVSLVLLMACGNFASLVMARAADRIHELGVRTDLGAKRSRLIRLMLTESLLLSIAGGALAALLSFAVLRMVARINPHDIPRFEETTMDLPVLLFGLFVSLATGLVSGIFPAVSASFVNAAEQLRQGGRAIAGTSWRARNTLIAGQVALSVVLLSGAGLLIRSYLAVLAQSKGFSSSTLTMSVTLQEQGQKSDLLRREIMDRIRAMPGVQLAGSIDDLPLSSYEDKGFVDVEGYVSKHNETVSVRETGGDYFPAMQIPLAAGRYLQDGDIGSGPQTTYPNVAVVSESFARCYFHNRNALGQHLRINGSPWSRIVGVVGDVRHAGLEEASEPIVYFQNGLADSVAIRTIGAPEPIIRSIRKTVSSLSPGAALADIQTMSSYVDRATARRRFQTIVLTWFAGVAFLLTLVGLYGLISYAVRQRTAEIGVRMAMGASRGAVLGMMLTYGLRLTATGLLIGIGLAFVLTRGMASFLYGIDAADPKTFAIVPVFTILVALAACLAPAWKAARIEPLVALRHQ